MEAPLFSILVSAYNREDTIERCLRSCLAQTLQDFEIVVVDDGSQDGTGSVVQALQDPRIRLIRHDRNRGLEPTRATAVEHASGAWCVILDSDDELLPHALSRLQELIGELPAGVDIIRSRYQADDGHLAPSIIPDGITDYHGRLVWLETVSGGKAISTDAAHCMRTSMLKQHNYSSEIRGSQELWEMDLARITRSLWVPEVLALIHLDAANSMDRELNFRRLLSRNLGEAGDAYRMGERIVSVHGSELSRYAPTYHAWLLESLATKAFLAGERRAGVDNTRLAIRAGAPRLKMLATLVIGMTGPYALAVSKAAGRQLRRHWVSLTGRL